MGAKDRITTLPLSPLRWGFPGAYRVTMSSFLLRDAGGQPRAIGAGAPRLRSHAVIVASPIIRK